MEFRDKATLSHLFARHPNRNRMTQILRNGSKWPLKPLTKDKRRTDVAEALTFGNHTGASLQPELLKNLVSKDVHSGYCLPLPLVKATKIPNILITRMNIQKQNTIKEYGRIMPKDCLTHNQSFKWLSGTSVNRWGHHEWLLPCLDHASGGWSIGPSLLVVSTQTSQYWHQRSIKIPLSNECISMQQQHRKPAQCSPNPKSSSCGCV